MSGIKDKVAIIGMGCSRFGERFEASREDLILEAVQEALDDAGLTLQDIDAFWFGSFYEMHGTSLASVLKPDFKPVTRIENNCCTGSDTLRNAAYAVASGAYKTVMAIGMDKLKDNGFSGNPFFNLYRDNTEPAFGGPASFSLLVPAYAEKYGVSYEDMREAMVHVSHKNHFNGAMNPKALYRKEMTLDQIRKSPMVCEPYLTIMDCSGVSDGAACAILTATENAKEYRPDPMYIKAAEIVASSGVGMLENSYDYTTILETEAAARAAYEKAGKRQLENPKLGMAHCLGGKPWNNVSSVTIVGKELG